MAANRRKKTKLRFACLERVSTEKQAKRGESLRVQYKANEAEVKRLGGVVVAHYNAKQGESATEKKEEGIVKRMMDDTATGEFDAIMMYEVDRLSRNNEQQAIWLKVLEDRGIRLFRIGREYRLDNADDRFILLIELGLAAYGEAKKLRRSYESKLARARRGHRAFGPNPFGYTNLEPDRSKPAKWVVIPECRDYLVMIWKWYAQDGMSWDAITRRLEKQSDTKKWKDLEKKLIDQHYPDFRKFPKNKEYLRRLIVDGRAAEIVWEQDTSKGSKKHGFSCDGPIRIKLPEPLLTKDQVERARHVGEMKGSKKHGNEYALSGFIFCEHCKKSMHVGGGGTHYRHDCTVGPDKGKSKHYRLPKVDTAVFQELGDFLNNARSKLRKAVTDAVTNRDRDINSTERKTAELEENIKAFKQEQKTAEDAAYEPGISQSARRRHLLRGSDLDADIERAETELKREQDRLERLQQPVGDNIAKQIDKLLAQISNRVPLKNSKRRKTKKMTKIESIHNLPIGRKKELIRFLMGGTVPPRHDPEFGIFISRDGTVRIRGVLGLEAGEIPFKQRKQRGRRQALYKTVPVQLSGLATLLTKWDETPSRSRKRQKREGSVSVKA